MQSVALTSHAREQLKKRWPHPHEITYDIGTKAWQGGRFLNDIEQREFFMRWSKNLTHRIFPDVRVWRDFYFIFDSSNPGSRRLITAFPYELPKALQPRRSRLRTHYFKKKKIKRVW